MMEAFDGVIEHNKKEPNPYEHYDDFILCLHTLANLVSTLGKEWITSMRDFAYGFRRRICFSIISRGMHSMIGYSCNVT
jgi:hypothetical protein